MKKKLIIGAIGGTVMTGVYLVIGAVGAKSLVLHAAGRRDRRVQRKMELRRIRRFQCEVAENTRRLEDWVPCPDQQQEIRNIISTAAHRVQGNTTASIISNGAYGPDAMVFMSGKSLDDIAAAMPSAGGIFPES